MSDQLAGGGDGQTPVHPDDLVGLRLRWISTQAELDEVERRNVLDGRRRVMAWRVTLVRALGDDVLLRRLHRAMFGEVWEWAGEYRRHATSIGIPWTSIGVSVRDALRDAYVAIEAAGTDELLDVALATLHHRLVVIHPFPNGNGRTARLMVDKIARLTGRPAASWGAGADDSRARYLDALRQADRGLLDALVAFLRT